MNDMKLTVIGSGSSGNCYLLTSNNQILIIEQGIPFTDVKKALNYDIMGIVGAITSHSHTDHSKYIEHYRLAGIPVYQPYLTGHKVTQMGDFRIQSFDVVHDVPCCGFYIKVEKEKILFITDTEYVSYNFAKIKPTTIICEANYQMKYIVEEDEKAQRVFQTHMELQTTKDFIKNNITNELRNVFLCHLSKTGIDPDEAIDEVKAVVGENVRVDVCVRGMEFEL